MGLKDLMSFIKTPNQVQMQNGQTIHFTLQIKLDSVDKNTIISNKVVAAKYYDSIVPYRYRYQRKGIVKKMLDIVANNNWKDLFTLVEFDG
jgi:hypothetical protein